MRNDSADEPIHKQVILWDIDGTLIDSSLEIRLLRFLLDNKHITIPRILANALRLTFKLPIPSLYQYKLYYLAGLNAEKVDGWIHQCWREQIKPSLRAGSVELIREINKRGRSEIDQIALSGTVDRLGQPLVNHFGFSALIAGQPEIKNTVYTGALNSPHPRGIEKVAQAELWLEENGYTWEQTIAIADNWDDRFLLEKSALGIAMTPDQRLLDYANMQSIEKADSIDSLGEILFRAIER